VFSGTLRASPNATVWAVSGIRCNLGASSASTLRFAASHPVLPVVYLVHEDRAGGLEFGEGAIVAAEVRVLRDDVGFGEFQDASTPPLVGHPGASSPFKGGETAQRCDPVNRCMVWGFGGVVAGLGGFFGALAGFLGCVGCCLGGFAVGVRAVYCFLSRRR